MTDPSIYEERPGLLGLGELDDPELGVEIPTQVAYTIYIVLDI